MFSDALFELVGILFFLPVLLLTNYASNLIPARIRRFPDNTTLGNPSCFEPTTAVNFVPPTSTPP